MRKSLLIAVALLVASCAELRMEQHAVARASLAADRAAIEAIEADWSRAFLARDHERIERIVAPEFKLLGWRDGKLVTTERADWMANTRQFDFRVFETDVLDVVVVDDTAVATVVGNWTVAIGDKVRPNTRFLVTDSWVRRDGVWQIIRRNAQTLD